MQAIMKVTYLGVDSFNGKKDPSKTYYNANFLQGSEVVRVFLESGQELIFDELNLQKFDELELVVAFSLGTDKYGARINYKLISVALLEPEIPFNLKEAEKEPEKEPDKKISSVLEPKAKTA